MILHRPFFFVNLYAPALIFPLVTLITVHSRAAPRASGIAVIPRPPACAGGIRTEQNTRSILPPLHAHTQLLKQKCQPSCAGAQAPSRRPPSALVSAPAGHCPCTADRPTGCAARHPRQSSASLSPSLSHKFQQVMQSTSVQSSCARQRLCITDVMGGQH